MSILKGCVLFTEVALCCLVVYSLHCVTGSSPEPCPDQSWNATFGNKAYYIVKERHTYTDQIKNVCGSQGIGLLVIDSLAENDFIVETLKAYEPSIQSKVFLACPADDFQPPRYFWCRGSDAVYNESSSSREGFWNWQGGVPATTNGRCILLNTEDGAWTKAPGCGPLSDFVICQCRRQIPPGTFVSSRFHQKAFENRNCLHSDLIMRLVPVDNFIQCVMQCQSDGNCASFNMRDGSGITSPISCQLSLYHSSIVQESSFIPEENCKYYERIR